MFKHLSECELCIDSCWLYFLSSLINKDEHDDISLTSHNQNHEILESNRNWSQLALKGYYIKNHEPIVNHGLKASKKNFHYLIKF